MASQNGSPGSHSVDTAGHCCTQRSTAFRSVRRSQAYHSACSSDGPGETDIMNHSVTGFIILV